MNPRVRRLLERLGLPDAGAPDLWRRTVMIKNSGSVPLPSGTPAQSATLGFLLVFLDARGNPGHVAKCRPAGDEGFERECRILERLAGKPELDGEILPVRTGRSGPLRLHLSGFLDEPRYDRVLKEEGRPPARWRRESEATLRAADRIGRAAGRLPGIAPERERVPVGREARSRARRLAGSGVDPGMLERVAAAAGDVELPARVQHGDLWPGNVFLQGGKSPRRLVDLERVGRIDVPLFDLFHWLWSSAWLLDRGEDGPWLPLDRNAAGGWKRAARELLRDQAGRLGLSDEQVGAALIFSVLEMTAFRRRPGAPDFYARRLLRDLEALDRRLGEGASAAELAGSPLSPPGAARRAG